MSKEINLIDQILQEAGGEDLLGDTENLNVNVDDILNENENYLPELEEKNLQFLENKEESIQELLNQVNSSSLGVDNIDDLVKSYTQLSETSVNKKKDKKYPKYNKPKDNVEYIENTYLNSKYINKDSFFLEKYRQQSKPNFSVLQFLPKTTLNSRFFREGNIITSIAASEDVIFTGNNLGRIKMYSCEKECEYKSLCCDDLIEPNKRSVVCLDISPAISHLISGYLNGAVALWDLSSSKCKKLIMNEHTNSVIAIKFIKVQNKYFEFISSDLDGVVKRISITDRYFFTTVDSGILLEKSDPFFLIEILKLNKDEKSVFADLDEMPVIVALGSLESLYIYQIEPVPKNLLLIKRPSYLQNLSVPDLCFGMGYPPRNLPSSATEAEKKQFEKVKTVIDITKQHRLISVSWGKCVSVYLLPFDPETGGETPLLLGHYVNKSNILRMGFISDSIIYIFDMYKYFKILNTGLFTPGAVQYDNITKMPVRQNFGIHSPELEKEQIIDQDVLFQAYIPDRESKSTKPTYNNLIVSQNKTIYLLGKRNFYYGKLLNWEQCINNLQQNSEWMEALTLGLDIYKGNNISLADIPILEDERKLKVGYVLKALILQYTINSSQNDSQTLKKEVYEELISKCINICIDFCVTLHESNYLMTQIKPLFDIKGFETLFIEKLQPFILADKFQGQKLGNKNISQLIQLYTSKNMIDVLGLILTHLDISSIDKEDIKTLCKEHHLITPLIYIYMNNDEGDYITPLNYIYDSFIAAKELKPNDIFIYEDNCDDDKLTLSKEYLGHKLLWYITMCLKGEKFHNDNKMNEKEHKAVAINIYIWLMKQSILKDILLFDSFSFFDVLLYIFNDDYLKNIFINESFDVSNNKGVIMKDKQLSRLNFSSFCEILSETVCSLNNYNIYKDFYEFIIKISINIPQVEITYILDAIIFIFKILNKDNNKPFDKFELHTITNEKEYIDTYSDYIISILKTRNICNKDLNNLLSISDGTAFINVTIYLLTAVHEYIKCLDKYINEEQLENKTKRTYEFIMKILDDYIANNSSEDLSKFKNELKLRYIKLAKLSISDLIYITEKYFNKEHSTALKLLSEDKEIELQYIETLLDTYKEDFISNEDKSEAQLYISYLNRHLELLCILKKYDEILPNLIKRQTYSVDVSLDLCLKYHVVDASVYLYKSMGALQDAYQLSRDECSNIINRITAAESEESIKSTLNKVQTYINLCIDICEINSDNNSVEDTEKLWFNLLQHLYDMGKDMSKKDIKGSTIIHEFISENIKETLNKMYSYVQLKHIIENLSNNYKDAEIKEFKQLLVHMLSSYSHLNNILESAQKLLGNYLKKKIKKFYKFIQKGNYYFSSKCEECKEILKSAEEEDIELFRCGHIIHTKCCLEENNEYICPICRQIEREQSVVTYHDYSEKVINYRKADFPDKERKYSGYNLGDDNKQVEDTNTSIFNNPENYEKLKNIDEYLIEIDSMF